MSKVGRNRTGLRWGVKPDRKTPWRPAEAKLEQRYEIVRRKSASGKEYISYKPIVVPKS